MNFINPLGRSVGDGIQPQACVCNVSLGNHASYKTTSCSTCNCGCNSEVANRTANGSSASNANTK